MKSGNLTIDLLTDNGCAISCLLYTWDEKCVGTAKTRRARSEILESLTLVIEVIHVPDLIIQYDEKAQEKSYKSMHVKEKEAYKTLCNVYFFKPEDEIDIFYAYRDRIEKVELSEESS